MARRQSVFASAKQIIQASASTAEELAHLTTDVVKYARQELQATSKSSHLENVLDFSSEKSTALLDMYSQLATVSAQSESELRTLQLAVLNDAINAVKSVQL